MKRIAALILAVLGIGILAGCGPEEPSQTRLNQACVGHGGVYHVERHERSDEESYMYLFLCQDKTVVKVNP